MEAEEALYNAWVAQYETFLNSDVTEEEQAVLDAKCWEAYEKAYTVLGSKWTQRIIRSAREFCCLK